MSSDQLQVFVVWLPRYPGDDRTVAETASSRFLTDRRAVHFWDAAGSLGGRYGDVLELPGDRTFAWDVYLAFDHTARWDGSTPEPFAWMHQLGNDTNTAGRLDGDAFRRVVTELIAGSSDGH